MFSCSYHLKLHRREVNWQKQVEVKVETVFWNPSWNFEDFIEGNWHSLKIEQKGFFNSTIKKTYLKICMVTHKLNY